MFPALRASTRAEEPTTAAERHRAYRATRELVERLAVKQPLVLVLDDLHWADAASLELVSHLFRRPPRARVVLAVGFRAGQAGHALDAVMDSALRESDSVHSITLGPLAPADAQALMGIEDPAEAECLYRRSGGNPFYMLELIAPAVVGNALRSAEDGDDVPTAVVAAMVRELEGLTVPARRLAEAGAVAGDPFELDLALATAGLGEQGGLDAIDELAGRDLVRSATAPRRFHFRHPLVRHAVYEACAPGVRLAAHERCADALAAQGAPAVMRAHHVQYAARQGDLGAVAVLREAGTRPPGGAGQRGPLVRARARPPPQAAPREDRTSLLRRWPKRRRRWPLRGEPPGPARPHGPDHRR